MCASVTVTTIITAVTTVVTYDNSNIDVSNGMNSNPPKHTLQLSPSSYARQLWFAGMTRTGDRHNQQQAPTQSDKHKKQLLASQLGAEVAFEARNVCEIVTYMTTTWVQGCNSAVQRGM